MKDGVYQVDKKQQRDSICVLAIMTTQKEIDKLEGNSKEVLDFLQELKECWVNELS